MPYYPAQADEMAENFINIAIENFKKKHGKIKPMVPKHMPIEVTAPDWMEQKATIDGLFAVAYGAYTHLSPTPFITGAPDLVKLLTEDVESLTGGKVAVGDDPVEAANSIEAHIMKKRRKMGI